MHRPLRAHRRLRLLLLLLLLLGAPLATSIPAVAADGAVTVSDSGFRPSEIRIEPQESATWTWEHGGHTVTADDGSFSSGGVRSAGATFTHRFDQPGTFTYGCELHGFMVGTVQVGPPPVTPTLDAPRLYVPSDVTSIQEAVAAALPGTEIVLEPVGAPFVLSSPVVVTTDDLTITTGTKPVETTTTTTKKTKKLVAVAEPSPPTPPPVLEIRRGDDADYAFDVAADGVTIEHLAIGDFVIGAVRVRDHRDVVLRDLRLRGGRDYGIHTTNANVAITDVTTSGYRRAGVSLQDCDDCGYVRRLASSGNFVGFEALDASAVVLEESSIHDNANGVIVQTRRGAAHTYDDVTTRNVAAGDIAERTTDAVPAGAFVRGNDIRDNDRTDLETWPTAFDGAVQPAVGVGVWLGGAVLSAVEDNDVAGHRWGIVASVFGNEASGNRILGNRVNGSELADLGWDGVGVGTCFGGNSAGSSIPLQIETVYACDDDGVPTVGVPIPAITGDIVLQSLASYYCRELVTC